MRLESWQSLETISSSPVPMVNHLARSLGATLTCQSRIVAHFQKGAGLQIPCYVQRHGFIDKARPQKLLPQLRGQGCHRHCCSWAFWCGEMTMNTCLDAEPEPAAKG